MTSPPVASLRADLKKILPSEVVLDDVPRPYLSDETETRSLVGHADAVVLPENVEQVAAAVSFAYRHDVALVPRGGGTGYAGGAVPAGGIVLGLEQLTRVRQFDPLFWRAHVEAGLTTDAVRRLARGSGLYFPPDPGAAEQSQIGGNIATNAGGPHAFKYGTTGAWVTGLEAVIAPGEIIRVGGAITKDVSGYDLRHLLIGSEGTLGVITAAWLRFIPAPEARLPAVAFFDGTRSGCAAIETVIGTGIQVAALEYVDEGALAAAPPPFLPALAGEARFAVIVEADGSEIEAAATIAAAHEAFDESLWIHSPTEAHDVQQLWRWREGMTAGVTAQLGGKVSEDITVPVDRLQHAIEQTAEIGRRHRLRSCSWGHAGDGNLHSTFMVRRESAEDLEAADRAAAELFELAISLGGSISGEHGIGSEKCGFLQPAWGDPAYALHVGIKDLFDPKRLLNPGKKQ